MNDPMRIVFLGLSLTSSWGNGHATTYRGLIRELDARGHDILFLERNAPWYASNRDMPEPPYARVILYENVADLKKRCEEAVAEADLVIVGSYVPDGVEVGRWVQEKAQGVTAFYDIDTPVTLGKLERNEWEYISPDLIPEYDLYLSFTGGPTLRRLEREYGAPRALPLYCSVDPEIYYPATMAPAWDLGYLGTYAADRQPTLERLLIEPARRWPSGRFVVAGPMYPDKVRWSDNITRIEHLPPAEHRRFYNNQRVTLNVTRADMVQLGYSPSVRLFEAAACGIPIISDYWEGIDELFDLGPELLIADTPVEVLDILEKIDPEELQTIGRRGRNRILTQHTAAHRAAELETYVEPLISSRGLIAPERNTTAAQPGAKPV
ncbi:CgeB family protein [Thiohalomonas denitrificans]|uniref:Spore maturation protein CgeB n=1 Tax=Thiohalomonas denitrificans TaxID=415747 RepID=A0A1G5Q3E0_9GAMM|nr:glycosyltransferase [Thiohalomonas denitrificans]SCZ56182.1 Spore maturation protein CgeB [Thiohalomonas denitrificans]